MKLSDEEKAKIDVWTGDPKPQPEIPTQPFPYLPHMFPRRFNSYEDFNKWKEELQKEVARVKNEKIECPWPDSAAVGTQSDMSKPSSG
jgi:hypothetical protein